MSQYTRIINEIVYVRQGECPTPQPRCSTGVTAVTMHARRDIGP
jgi:hypothetical protein